RSSASGRARGRASGCCSPRTIRPRCAPPPPPGSTTRRAARSSSYSRCSACCSRRRGRSRSRCTWVGRVGCCRRWGWGGGRGGGVVVGGGDGVGAGDGEPSPCMSLVLSCLVFAVAESETKETGASKPRANTPHAPQPNQHARTEIEHEPDAHHPRDRDVAAAE